MKRAGREDEIRVDHLYVYAFRPAISSAGARVVPETEGHYFKVEFEAVAKDNLNFDFFILYKPKVLQLAR